jgi:hypothetical protein
MSKRVFQVTHQLKWSDLKEWGHEESVTVLASDAERAIVAARKHQMQMTLDADDEGGKPSRVVGFRLIGVESVVAVEVIA